ncbi:MAG: hypothetical protein AAFQ66_23060, partial [Pseudomonadota bacterium]
MSPSLKLRSSAAPTAGDIAAWSSLSDDEKHSLLHAELDNAKASNLSSRSLDDLWHEALERAGQVRLGTMIDYADNYRRFHHGRRSVG